MEYAKKGPLGGYRTVAPDEGYTHCLLTVEEYKKLQQRIKQAKEEAAAARADADQRVRKAKNDAEASIEKAEAICDTEVERIKKALRQAESDRDYQKGLNVNLLRISRERANADRKLKNKKEHSGYVVISSIEKDQVISLKNHKRLTVPIWETVLQTPYSIEFTLDQVQRQTREDLLTMALFLNLGIDAYVESYEEMLIGDKQPGYKKKFCDQNTVFEIKHKANYRAGFWELVLHHLKPLGQVPPGMRP